MKALNIKFYFFILFSILLFSTSLYSDEKDFSVSYNENLYGNVKQVGNSVLQIDTNKNKADSNYFLSDDKVAYGRYINSGIVQQIWSNGWVNISGYEANNFTYMKYINVDNNSDDSIFNSSSSTLTLPADSKVVFARLYWAGLIHNFANGTSIDSKKTSSKSIKFKIKNINIGNGRDNFIDLSVSQTNNYASTEGWTEIATTSGNLKYSRYSAYKDITSYFSNLVFDGSVLTITTANVLSEEGWMRNYGNYGAWNLVVIYENSNESFKNISLSTGYKLVYGNTVSLNFSNFLTPKSSAVESSVSIFSVEGEKTPQFGEDYLKIANKSGTLLSITNNGSYPNKKTNIFDSTITNNEVKTPSITNTMGIDIDTFEIGADGDSTHPQIMENLQSSTIIELSSGGDAYTVNAVVFATELYVPRFCYDYSYKQHGQYFTEDNNGSKDPSLIGSVYTSTPVEMTIYLKNLVDSDVNVKDMNVNILDLNTTQVIYKRNTTALEREGDLAPQDITDGSLTVADNYIKNIQIGSLSSNEYFYIYYDLTPKRSELNTPIDFRAKYNIEINGDTISYELKLGSEIEMCTNNNFAYTPAKGIFNVVHNNYYNLDLGGTNKYYNLPTQVTNREGNFKVISLDPDNLDTLKGASTMVAVEMIDAGAFHDVNASCQETSNSITDRVWVMFENNATSTSFNKTALQNAINDGRTELTNTSSFYKTAKANAAFRVSYNLTNDGNEELVKIQDGRSTGLYKINFTELVQDLHTCAQDMDGNLNNTDTVAQYCGNNSDRLTKQDIATCMECVYGYNTRRVCSRDNFSIRPEAFLINLKDQNQTNPTSQRDMTTNYSGVVSATAPNINMAAEYEYNIEVNATNHIDNNASLGYKKTFNLSNSDTALYIWEPIVGQVISGCNDDTNKTIHPSYGFRFLNGIVDMNSSVVQVGDYRLNITDTTWTSVDWDTAYMSHHTGSYFKDAINNKDCLVNTTQTQSVNSSTLNGCNISSSHLNNDNNRQYNDFSTTFYPYKFKMSSITPSVDLNHTSLSTNSYIYMSDITKPADENMSFHLNGTFIAAGYDDSKLTNFVNSCYAKPLDLNVSKSDTTLLDENNNPVTYRAMFHNLDINNTILNDINTTQTNHLLPMRIQTTQTHFIKDLNGSMNTILNINYDRDQRFSVNPKKITYSSYDINCTDPLADCTFNADLITNKTTSGSLSIDNNITHYYGRAHAPRHRFNNNTNQQAFIYYEVYCSGAGCDKTLLQDKNDSNTTDDPRWFINTKHKSNFGLPGRVTQRSLNIVTEVTPATGNHKDSVIITYDGSRGNPYRTTMEHNASGWLIYNKYSASVTRNEFEVEFEGGSSGWAGKHETNTTTTNNAADRTNRRIMW